MGRAKGVKLEFSLREVKSFDDILSTIFWKERELVPIAREFLDYITYWSRTDTPYTVKEWKSYCMKKGISQSSYHNMLKRLKNVGLVEKIYNPARKTHELHPSRVLRHNLNQMVRILESYFQR